MSVPPRFLVTGASGFVGAAVVRLAVARGHAGRGRRRPAVADSTGSRPSPATSPSCAPTSPTRCLVAAAVAAARPDACVHLAAAGAVVREDDLDLLLAANTRAPARLARTLADAGCARLVTPARAPSTAPSPARWTRPSACAPDDPYGVAKLAAAGSRAWSRAGTGSRPLTFACSRSTAPARTRAGSSRPSSGAAGAAAPSRSRRATGARLRLRRRRRRGAARTRLCAPASTACTANVGTGVQTSIRDLCLALADLTGGHELLRFGALPTAPASASPGAPPPSMPRARWAGARARRSTTGCATPSP